VEALLNRFFLEPLLGMGYPTDVMPALNYMDRFIKQGDREKMAFDFDFIGLQYYFRVMAKFSLTPPILFAEEVKAIDRRAKRNTMDLEVYPKGLKQVLKFYSAYPQLPQIYITESGVCYPDYPIGGHVHDVERLDYHKEILKVIKKAIKKILRLAVTLRGHWLTILNGAKDLNPALGWFIPTLLRKTALLKTAAFGLNRFWEAKNKHYTAIKTYRLLTFSSLWVNSGYVTSTYFCPARFEQPNHLIPCKA
jgi:hypothetical protein